MADPKKRKTSYIAFGSEEHKAMLGLAAGVVKDPQLEANLMEALKAIPTPSSDKLPITPEYYRSTTRYEPGDEIFMGFARKSSGGR
jgi:hypothetical protein